MLAEREDGSPHWPIFATTSSLRRNRSPGWQHEIIFRIALSSAATHSAPITSIASLPLGTLLFARRALQEGDETGVLILAGEIEGRPPCRILRIDVCPRGEQQLDHSGVAKVNRYGKQERRVSDRVDRVDIGAALQEQASQVQSIVVNGGVQR